MTIVTKEDEPKSFATPVEAIRYMADQLVTLRLLALDMVAEAKRDDVRGDLRRAHDLLLAALQACDLADARIAAVMAHRAEVEARMRLEMLLEAAGDGPVVSAAAD